MWQTKNSMIGKLNADEIEKLLNEQTIGRIGCYDNEKVYVVPVSYAYDGKYIYIRSFEGKKIEMMRKNPTVCFQVDSMQNMANWQSVIASGDFEELTDERERIKALQVLIDRHLPVISSETTHLGGTWPFSSDDVNTIKGIVFRIQLKDKTGRFEKNETVSVGYIG
jgi:nitroimidazol reductase NimA-like FMN-containing flavoprotein (pyridoxamine 5'-phosphate oxidase superfamily)